MQQLNTPNKVVSINAMHKINKRYISQNISKNIRQTDRDYNVISF